MGRSLVGIFQPIDPILRVIIRRVSLSQDKILADAKTCLSLPLIGNQITLNVSPNALMK